MRAASLGHLYLNVKSSNENDIYFNSGRFRVGRKHQRLNPKQQQNDNQRDPSLSASDPLSRRSVIINEPSESATPSVTILGRSHSESNDIYVIYEQQPSNNAQFQYSDRGMNIFCLRFIFGLFYY
jgi:hypothetical protein